MQQIPSEYDFNIISQNSTESFEIETRLSLSESISRINNTTSSQSGAFGWDTISTVITQINENEYHFRIVFKRKSRQLMKKDTVAETYGILHWNNEEKKTVIKGEYSKIDRRLGYIIGSITLCFAIVTILELLNGVSSRELTGFIIATVSLSIIFVLWLEKASYSYRAKHLISNLFKVK